MKIKCLLLSVLLVLSLAACGGAGEDVPPTPMDMQGLDVVLNDIREHVEIGTAGASLKAVPYSVQLLDWLEAAQMSGEELKAMAGQWKASLGGESEELQRQMDLVFDVCRQLTEENGDVLLESAGVESDGSWSEETAGQVGMLLNGMGYMPTVVDEANPLNLPATPAPPKAQRPATKTETIMNGEGMEETVSYTLVQGDGWSFYLTDGDWQTSGYNTWTAIYNENVILWIEEYPNMTADEIKAKLQADGYDENLFKNDRTFRNAVAFDGVAFMYETPAHSEYAEGWGFTLSMMAQTFVVE